MWTLVHGTIRATEHRSGPTNYVLAKPTEPGRSKLTNQANQPRKGVVNLL